jgi:LPXTG-site transpeptidase (sortase) family protein
VPSGTGDEAVEEEHPHQDPNNTTIGRRSRIASIALISAGLLVLAGVGAYFGYASYADSQLENLTFSAEAYVASSFDGTVRLDPPTELTSGGRGGSTAGFPNSDTSPDTLDSTATLLGYTAAYPGVQLHPKYWHEPLWAGTDTRQAQGLPDGFRAVAGSDELLYTGDNALAHRIQIPMLRLDSDISDLAILDLGDSRAYETPNNTVGHIPGTSNPGERGNGWFFGHLESPIRGEGNVFQRLPEIPELLRNYVETGDDPVYISLTSADGEYLYVVTATQVVHQDDLRLNDSDDAAVTLVTCVPRLVYDHRLLVTARLVGIKG